MNKWNNFNTLELYKGSIWVTRHNKESEQSKGINICQYVDSENDFRVLYYVIKNKNGYTFDHSKFYSLDEIIKVALQANGTEQMLESEEIDIATCLLCGNNFLEDEINMIDYDIDLCAECEKEYNSRYKNNISTNINIPF